ncbi:hypothetical protein [Microbacterium sp. cx-59]|uniref:hypothetical protein n=1 Tax=Microbacterium sp. cx-59 TaxID=2891207 RepID=UPI001E450CC6|nr:hypothetical protein [Microbacterium sp. cx-59]MCC4906931.1 hypothetical protein [Microbacterium sp. cx-59]
MGLVTALLPHAPVAAGRHVADAAALRKRARREKRRALRRSFRDWVATFLIGEEPVDVDEALSRLDLEDGRRIPRPGGATAPRA